MGQEPELTQSIVRDVLADDLVLSPPVRVLQGSVVPAQGHEDGLVTLFWDGPSGRGTLKGRVEETQRDRWRVRPLGAGQLEQRRGAVREQVHLPVVLSVSGRDIGGQAVDLSESGFRAVVDEQVPAPAAVVHLTIDGTTLSIPFAVVRSAETQPGSGVWVVAGRFEHSPKHSDTIRRYVFARQRRAIRRGL